MPPNNKIFPEPAASSAEPTVFRGPTVVGSSQPIGGPLAGYEVPRPKPSLINEPKESVLDRSAVPSADISFAKHIDTVEMPYKKIAKRAVLAALMVIVLGAGGALLNIRSPQKNLGSDKQAQLIASEQDQTSSLQSSLDSAVIKFNRNTIVNKNFSAKGQVAIQNEADTVDAFQIQNAAGKNLFIADTKNNRVGIGTVPNGTAALQVAGDISTNGALVSSNGGFTLGPDGLKFGSVLVCSANGCVSSSSPAPSPSFPSIDVANVAYLNKNQTFSGNINTNSGFSVNGTAGASLTCPSGDYIKDAKISGGLIVSGSCTPGPGVAVATMQQVYDASSPALVNLSSGSGPVRFQDAVSPLVTDLFEITNSTGTNKYLAVSSAGVSVFGDSNVTGQYKVNGSQISSANLSNDSNLAKLDANQTFTGTNTFSNAANSFTGSGAGLTNVNAATLGGQTASYYTNAGNIGAGTLNDSRLSSNVALLSASQTFSGNNNFTGTVLAKNTSDSTAAFQVQNSSGGNLFNIDSANSNVSINGTNTGALQAWSTTNSIPQARYGNSVVAVNGYIYSINGADSTNTPISTVYYAKLNADGSTGAWGSTTNTNLPARVYGGAVAVNGYIYYIGGSDGTNPTNIVYSARVKADGTLSSWTAVTSLPANKMQFSYASYNGYIYALGGMSTTSNVTLAVYYAKANPDGTVGNWTSSFGGFLARYLATSVAANGYLYTLGGISSSSTPNTSNDVMYSKINADGSLGSWTLTNPTGAPAIMQNAAVVANGYIYTLNGQDNGAGNGLASVSYAKLNTNGSTGAWTKQSNPTGLVASRYLSSVAYNGYVYNVGGFNGAYLQTVNYTSTSRLSIGGSIDLVGSSGLSLADGTGGSLTAGNTQIVGSLQVRGSGSFAQSVNIGDGLAVGGQAIFKNIADSTSAFQVQNSSGVSLLSVDSANGKVTLNSQAANNANAFSVIDSSSRNILNVDTVNSSGQVGIRTGANPGAALAVGSDSLGLDIFKVVDQTSVGATVFKVADEGAATFQNRTNSTTAFQIQNAAGQSLLQVDTTNSKVTLDGLLSGSLGTWQTNANSGFSVYGSASVVVNGYLYQIGGNGTGVKNWVGYAKINADGSTGTIYGTTLLPIGLYYHTAVSYNGYIYVVGGYDSSLTDQVKTYYARVNPDGTISSWSTSSNDLPAPVEEHSSVVANGYIYVIGGRSGGSDISNSYFAKINADGSIGPWQGTSSLPVARSSGAAVSANGYIYYLAGSQTSTVYYTKANTDGTLAAWSTNASSLPLAVYGETAIISNGHIYSIGGYDINNGPVASVYSALLNIDGSTGSWTLNGNTIPTASYKQSSVTANGYIYVISPVVAPGAIYYASTPRVQIGANLDLVGLQGGTLADGGSIGQGSTGGSITAGNITAIGSLQVQGSGSFMQGLGTNGNLNVNGSALFQNANNSTTALQIQNSSGGVVLQADTTNSRLAVGNIFEAPTSTFEVEGPLQDAANGLAFNIKSFDTSAAAQNVGGGIGFGGYADTTRMFGAIQGFHESATASDYSGGLRFFTRQNGLGNLSEVARLGSNGAVLFKNSVDSTSAFQVQNAAGTENLMSIDTTARGASGGNIVKIGNNTGTDGSTTILVVDSASTDPTSNLAALNGGIFYNSNTNKLSIIENGQVKILCNQTDQLCGGNSTTMQQAYTASTGGTTPEVKVDSTRGGVDIQDADSTISSNLFTVRGSNGAGLGAPIFNVQSSGQVQVGSMGTPTGQLYVGGQKPTLIGSNIDANMHMSNTPGPVMAISGSYGYVASMGSNKLLVYSLSDPSNPTYIGQNADSNLINPFTVAVQGHFAYVVEYNNPGKLVVYDISNPSSPTYVGQNSDSTIQYGNAIYISGHYAYVGYLWTNSGFSIYDISNPTNPTLVSSVSLFSGTTYLYTAGRYLYVADGTSKLDIYDVSNPFSPTLTGSIPVSNPRSVSVYKNYAYVVGNSLFQVFDISNPASPVDVSSGGVAIATGTLSNLAISGHYAYVVGNSLFQVFDISNPASPVDVSSGGVATAGTSIEVAVLGRYAYVVNETSPALQVFDLGGTYSQQLEVGGAEVGSLQVSSNGQIAGDLNIQGSMGVARDVQINGTISAGNTVIRGTFQNSVDSVTAFQVQNSSGSSLFTIDTSASTITLGVPSGTPVLLVVGNKNTSGDPSCINGAIYYNSNSSSFRGCANGGWTSFGNLHPSARVYSSVTQDIPTATVTALTFDSERWDQGGLHEAVTNPTRITITQAGKYHISGNIEWPVGGGSRRILSIKLNGTTIIAQTETDLPASQTNTQTINTDWNFSAGDYVEILGYQDSGSPLTVPASTGYQAEFSAVWDSE